MTALWNSAFTLIELLVVVLIIGILAAIAVPQYQKVVEKSRLMEALVLGRHIQELEEIYYLVNGTYTDNFENLDLEIPEGYNLVNQSSLSKNMNSVQLENTPDNRRCIFYYRSSKNLDLALFFGFTGRKRINCHPYTPHGTDLCASLKIN